CGGCHNAANHGANVQGILFDIGTADADIRPDDQPLYTFRSLVTGEEVQSTDPGLARVSGRFDDLNKFKVPTLRGLSTRAPYFHNGIAKDLRAVIDHYEEKLGFDFTEQEERDLAAFLAAL
ncbi:MAG TPA: hypothetical protein VKZ63_03780, partial [Kofleriaceae bacterium]|nr:hypothetical protein [Kofleriaceae bacterium]